MNIATAFDILSDLIADKDIAQERIFTATFQDMLDKRMVAFDGYRPCLMPAGRAYHEELDRKRKAANKRNARAKQNRAEAIRSLGMKRTSGGWE